MMATSSTVVLGIVIPSADPIFLSVVGAHVLLGLGCVVSGVAAMLATKGRGYHSTFGTMYYWFMCGTFLTMATLAFMRWSEDYVLFVLGAMAFVLVALGRFARSYGLSLRVHPRTREWFRQPLFNPEWPSVFYFVIRYFARAAIESTIRTMRAKPHNPMPHIIVPPIMECII